MIGGRHGMITPLMKRGSHRNSSSVSFVWFVLSFLSAHRAWPVRIHCCAVAVVLLEVQTERGQPLAQMLLLLAGEHARKDVRCKAIFGAMVNQT